MQLIVRSAVLLLMLTSVASADLLILKSGGRIEGTVLNPDEEPREKFVVKLDTGGRVTLGVDKIGKFVPATEAQRWYRRNLAKMPPTAKANFKLAVESGRRGLKAERKFHLQETIRLEPNHKDARKLLGYSLR
ncbi:MAG: hypothetical protein AAF497_26890, partial [Planctomycetota bacterium]